MPEDTGLTEGFSIIESQANYEKRPLEEIVADANKLDVDAIAVEVISWAITNVESYVESESRSYQLNLVLDAEDEAEEELDMPETRKLQALYRAVPDDSDEISPEEIQRMMDDKTFIMKGEDNEKLDKIVACKQLLDEITNTAYNKIQTLDEYLEVLYKRLIYYYEMVAVRSGEPILRQLEGAVQITKFEYDAFPVGVRVRSPIMENLSENKDEENVSENEEKGVMLREYVIPEGFVLFIELAFKDVRKASSLF